MLGIDVSKNQLVCTLFDPATKQQLWVCQKPNNSTGVKQLLRRTPPQAAWVLEPTGRYSHTVAQQAVAQGREVLLAQPKRAKHYLNSLQSRAKTDRLDSYGLGLYALNCALPPYPLKSAMAEEIDQLQTARKGIGKAIASLNQRVAELPYAADELGTAVKALEEQRNEMDRRLAQLTRQAKERAMEPDATPYESCWIALPQLRAVPGIGPVVATAVLSCLSTHHFARADQFVAYCGLDINIRQSGRKRGQMGLTKQGSAELRRLFFLAASASLIAKDSPFKAQYERELAKGMSRTAAICAIARKMARLCWSLAMHGTAYDPQRVYQQPKN